jgi:hypothetical protein
VAVGDQTEAEWTTDRSNRLRLGSRQLRQQRRRNRRQAYAPPFTLPPIPVEVSHNTRGMDKEEDKIHHRRARTNTAFTASRKRPVVLWLSPFTTESSMYLTDCEIRFVFWLLWASGRVELYNNMRASRSRGLTVFTFHRYLFAKPM